MKLPSTWNRSRILPPDVTSTPAPQPKDASRYAFYGVREEDNGYRLYDVPADVPLDEVVRYFEVGSHGANSYGLDAELTVNTTASNAVAISEIIPCKVAYADMAGLRLVFQRTISEADLTQIERLFPEDDPIAMGLEGYLAEWDGQSRLLGKLLADNCIHFWWD